MQYMQLLSDAFLVLLVITICCVCISYIKKMEILSGLYNTEMAHLASIIIFMALWFIIRMNVMK